MGPVEMGAGSDAATIGTHARGARAIMKLDPIALSVARRFRRAAVGNVSIEYSDADVAAGGKTPADDLARLLYRLRSVRLVCCCGRPLRGKTPAFPLNLNTCPTTPHRT
jgi:hypothetical protein